MVEQTQGIWLTRRDAAAYAQVSEATIGREVRSGRLRHARVGGRRSLRFRHHWIDNWLAAAQPAEESTVMEEQVEVALRIPRYIRAVERSRP